MITIPKVADILSSSEKSTVEASAKLYIRGVEQAILSENTKAYFNPSLCTIESDGNLNCQGKTLVIESSGNRPSAGTIVIRDRKPVEVLDMVIGDFALRMQEGGDFVVFGTSKDITPQGTYLMVNPRVTSAETTFLGGSINRSQVETITVTNTKNVSSNAIASWDVSALKDKSVMAWYTDVDNNNLYELYIGGEGGVKANSNSSYLFSMFLNATTIDVTYLNTNNVTSMESMFDMDTNSIYYAVSGNSKLIKIIGIEKIDTSQVKKMNKMFYALNLLENLNVSNFNTNQVTNMSAMFTGCKNLKNLDVSNFNTSKVTDMSLMFSGCINLKNLDVSDFNTNKVTNMAKMFYTLNLLENLNVSNFNTSEVTDMSLMFTGCINLKNLDVSNFNTSKVTNMQLMFYNCKNLISIDVSNFNTSKVTNMNSMFQDCSSLTSLNISNFDTSNVTYMSSMFSGCLGLTSLNLSNFNTSKVTNMSYMFYGCSKLETIDLRKAVFTSVTNSGSILGSTTALTTVYVKDAAAQTFINSQKAGVAQIVS